jgi:hypothetical protein
MYRALSSIVPKASDLLALNVEELGTVLLTHLKSCEGAGNTVFQNGLISQPSALARIDPLLLTKSDPVLKHDLKLDRVRGCIASWESSNKGGRETAPSESSESADG